MRTNEERIEALHRRAKEIEKKRRDRQILTGQIAGIVACVALVFVLAFTMPGFSDNYLAGHHSSAMSASIFSDNNMLGFVVIGILSFGLGVAVTIFCFCLHKWQKNKESEQEEKQ